jgi:hypothetical protein
LFFFKKPEFVKKTILDGSGFCREDNGDDDDAVEAS